MKRIFWKNAAILTGTALVLRGVGIFFRVWMAGRLGAEGMGLYQLIVSASALASTFAGAGISTAVTRLLSDELALGVRRGVLRILRRALLLTTGAAGMTAALLLGGARPIATFLLGDVRAAPALRVFCFSLPFLGGSACLRGYFIARRRAGPASASQLLEQAVRIAAVVWLMGRAAGRGLAASCAAVLAGDALAEAASCLFLALVFRRDRRAISPTGGRTEPPRGVTRRLLHIALPIAGGRYLNSGLRTAENALMPAALTQFGGSRPAALSRFGAVKGMALPILLFPASLLGAVSTLLVPELSEAAARGRERRVRRAAERALSLTLGIALPAAVLFFLGADALSRLVYHDVAVGRYLRALAPLAPFMYLDSVCDAMLKGLDEQGFTFRNSVLDSALRIPLILLLVPRFGMPAFLGVMYFSNLFTSLRNLARLLRVARLRLPFARIFLRPLAAAGLAALCGRKFVRFVAPATDLGFLCAFCAVFLPLYLLLIRLTSRFSVRAAVRTKKPDPPAYRSPDSGIS